MSKLKVTEEKNYDLRMLKNILKIGKRKTTQPRSRLVPAPESVVFGLNNVCNFKCEMCYIWKNKTLKEIPLNKIKRIIDEIDLFNNKDLTIQFHGGETLLYKGLTQAIHHASKKNIRTALATNGYFLDKKTIINLNEAGLHGLNISLDSIEKEVHNDLRGMPNSYEKIMYALDFLEKYEHNMVIGINTIIHSLNITKLVEMSRFVQNKKSVEIIYFIPLEKPYESDYDSSWYDSSPVSYLWPNNKDLINKMFDSLISEKKINKKISNSVNHLEKYRSYYLNPNEFIKKYGCNFGNVQLHINYSGQMRLCTIRPELETVGTVDDNIIKIWNSGKAKEIRHEMKNCTNNCILILSCGYKDED